MKILLTGGAGYIGSHTAVELFNSGHEPIILDNFSNSEKWIINRIGQILGTTPNSYEGDCTDIKFVNSIFKKENIDGVIHFAAFKAVSESTKKPLLYYKNNINSLLCVLEAMKKHDVKNIIFSSSATVYGQPDTTIFTENTPRMPAISPYGNTKLICEDIIKDEINSASTMSAIALRYFNPIGAHSSHLIGELPIGTPNNLIPIITQTAAGIRDKITIYGNDYDTADGTCIRDYIHVSDLANAHITALEYLNEQRSPLYDVFNVGTGKGASVLEILNTFENINNTKLKYSIGSRRDGDIASYWADTTKINSTLQWRSTKTIEDALSSAWEWQKSLGGNPSSYVSNSKVA